MEKVKKNTANSNKVFGQQITAAKPTVLGAAVFAATVTFPIGVLILLVDLILL